MRKGNTNVFLNNLSTYLRHARKYLLSYFGDEHDLAKGLKLKPITNKGDTPSPRAYCAPPYFGLAYCVPFYNKHNHFGVSIYIKKIKWQYIACTCTIILANVAYCVPTLCVLRTV